MTDRFEHVAMEFESLEKCIEYVQKEKEGDYLFRGEKTDRYLTTTSMLERVRKDLTLPPRCREMIERRAQQLHRDLQEFLGFDSDLALGFLQHYEVPTKLLDLTSNPDTAAFFAANGDPGKSGLLAAVPRNVGKGAIIQDLAKDKRATRPIKQSAFTFFSETYSNLKADECIKEIGVEWFRFTLTGRDKELYADKDLLDAHTDPVAGVIQLLLDDLGKTNDWTAKWLADHVAVAPFITQVEGVEPLVVGLISCAEAGKQYDEEVERFNNHRIWSYAYPDTRGHGGFANLRNSQLKN